MELNMKKIYFTSAFLSFFLYHNIDAVINFNPITSSLSDNSKQISEEPKSFNNNLPDEVFCTSNFVPFPLGSCYDMHNNKITAFSNGMYAINFLAGGQADYYPSGEVVFLYYDGTQDVYDPRTNITIRTLPYSEEQKELDGYWIALPNPYPLDPIFFNTYIKPYYPNNSNKNKKNNRKIKNGAKKKIMPKNKENTDKKLLQSSMEFLNTDFVDSMNLDKPSDELPLIPTNKTELNQGVKSPERPNLRRSRDDMELDSSSKVEEGPHKIQCLAQEDETKIAPKWGGKVNKLERTSKSSEIG